VLGSGEVNVTGGHERLVEQVIGSSSGLGNSGNNTNVGIKGYFSLHKLIPGLEFLPGLGMLKNIMVYNADVEYDFTDLQQEIVSDISVLLGETNAGGLNHEIEEPHLPLNPTAGARQDATITDLPQALIIPAPNETLNEADATPTPIYIFDSISEEMVGYTAFNQLLLQHNEYQDTYTYGDKPDYEDEVSGEIQETSMPHNQVIAPTESGMRGKYGGRPQLRLITRLSPVHEGDEYFTAQAQTGSSGYSIDFTGHRGFAVPLLNRRISFMDGEDTPDSSEVDPDNTAHMRFIENLFDTDIWNSDPDLTLWAPETSFGTANLSCDKKKLSSIEDSPVVVENASDSPILSDISRTSMEMLRAFTEDYVQRLQEGQIDYLPVTVGRIMADYKGNVRGFGSRKIQEIAALIHRLYKLTSIVSNKGDIPAYTALQKLRAEMKTKCSAARDSMPTGTIKMRHMVNSICNAAYACMRNIEETHQAILCDIVGYEMMDETIQTEELIWCDWLGNLCELIDKDEMLTVSSSPFESLVLLTMHWWDAKSFQAMRRAKQGCTRR